MKETKRKILAVLEVVIVTFGIVPLVARGINEIFPEFEAWQTETLGFSFPVFPYAVMVGISMLIILLHRQSLAHYGIHFQPLKDHLEIAAACFFPIALSNIPIAMGINYRNWNGALILTLVNIALLFFLAVTLRKKPSPVLGMTSAYLFFLMPGSGAAGPSIWKVITVFLTFALFVGFGEEILFRGYMHTRLNDVFGKPYQFMGVSFGWGAIITALLFGMMHIGILKWIIGYSTEVTLAWGFWTFFGGLISGYIREKSGSILAPALLHGLPQGIGFSAMLFFAM